MNKDEIIIYLFPIMMGLILTCIAIILENYYILLIMLVGIVISLIILKILRNSPITQESKRNEEI